MRYLNQSVIKGLAGVVAETITYFDGGVMEDDIATAEAIQFEGAVCEVEHRVSQKIIWPTEAWLRGDADEAVCETVAHHAAVVQCEVGLDAIVETSADFVVEDVVAHLWCRSVVLHMTDAIAEAGDAVVSDHIAAASELDALALVVAARAHDFRLPFADAGDDVVLDAGVHHAGLVGLDAKL